MFQELHRKTVELLAAKTSNYLFEPFENVNNPTTPSTSLHGVESLMAGRAVYDAVFDQEQDISQTQSDERVQTLAKCMAKLQVLHDQQEICSKSLGELRETYASVAEKTSSLHTACDQMMSQQTQLAAANEQVKTNLYHYRQYDWIMKKLQTSKLSLTGTLFTQVLSTIHECICYLRAHIDEKEAEIYLHKYEQCLSKSLTAIKAGVLADLESCKEEVFYRQARGANPPASPVATTAGGGGAEERNPVSAYVNDDTFALLYGVFGVKANTVRNALAQAHRFFADTAEYQTVVGECEAEYFGIRDHLLRPIVEATVERLRHRHANSSCNLTRDGCVFLLRLCDDEFRLYKHFFLLVDGGSGGANTTGGGMSSGMQSAGVRTPATPFSMEALFWRQQPQQTSLPFDNFMEGLCTILYDTLRPIIIANPHLETLTQLCALIKVEMIEERCGKLMPTSNAGLSSIGGGGGGSASVVRPMSGTTNMSAEMAMNPRAGFARVMGELVGDIVERIVYRTSLFAQSDVLGYCPAPGDLAYPERLLMMNDIKKQNSESTTVTADVNTSSDGRSSLVPLKNDLSSPTAVMTVGGVGELTPLAASADAPKSGKKRTLNSQSSAIDLHCLWYPTVRRTVMCLSKLYKCLDPTVFLSISSELLEACCESLELAAEKIRLLPVDSAKATVKSAGRTLDAELFVVKHLLILREQTSPYRSLASKQNRKIHQNYVNHYNNGSGGGAASGSPAPRQQGGQPRGRLSRSSSITSLASAGGGGVAGQGALGFTDFMESQQQFDYTLDLTRYKNSMFELLSAENRGRWFEFSSNNAVLSFLLAAPVHVSEFQTDSRRIIEAHLRKYCHDLIRFVTKLITASLTQIVVKIDQFEQKMETNSENAEQVATIGEPPKQSPQNAAAANQGQIRQRTLDLSGGFEELMPRALNDATSIAFKNVKQNWPMVRSAFSLYIGSPETEEILLQPIRKAVVQLFSGVAVFTHKHFSHEQRQIASVPEQEQIWLLLNSGGSIAPAIAAHPPAAAAAGTKSNGDSTTAEATTTAAVAADQQPMASV